MRNFKNQRGITLVALVVTIIVLLILAGVTLSLVAGENGILGRATRAVDTNEIATAKEQVGLMVSDLVAGYYETKYVNHVDTYNNQLEYIIAEIGDGKDTDNGEYRVTITSAGKITVTGGALDASSNLESITGTIANDGKITWDPITK